MSLATATHSKSVGFDGFKPLAAVLAVVGSVLLLAGLSAERPVSAPNLPAIQATADGACALDWHGNSGVVRCAP